MGATTMALSFDECKAWAQKYAGTPWNMLALETVAAGDHSPMQVLASLLELREHALVEEFRRDGATCGLCDGGAYPPWLTDDETWRKVMGDSQQQVCLACFYGRAETSEPLKVAVLW